MKTSSPVNSLLTSDENNCVRLADKSYINASKVNLSKEKHRGPSFIAAQAPNIYGVANFFKMLKEENVFAVITIGEVRNVNKCIDVGINGKVLA